MTARKNVVILGSTGSVGTQALEVIASHPEMFAVVGLSAAGGRPQLLAEQALAFGVGVVGIAKGSNAQDVQLALYAEAQRRGFSDGDVRLPRLVIGPEAATTIAGLDADIVLNAVDGAAGLHATLAALEAGTTLALANKESLIVGGDLVTSRAKPGQIVPVDSEHSALAQCLRAAGEGAEVRRLVLTASGGPFRGRSRGELRSVTASDALAHPTWSMGPVITTNSSTLVNKGLEVIEAHLLFGIDYDDIDVVVHPQSIVHSMVEFADGSTIAQLSPPDMKLPISVALCWPSRLAGAGRPMDWTSAQRWDFEPLDHDVFPAVRLAVEAGRRGGIHPAVFNAANEVCVDAFLAGHLGYLDIVATVAAVLRDRDVRSNEAIATIDDVMAADAWARSAATARIAAMTPTAVTP